MKNSGWGQHIDCEFSLCRGAVSATVSAMDNRRTHAIQHQLMEKLPPSTREWLEKRPPDMPRMRSLPWIQAAVLSALTLAVAAHLMVKGWGGFSPADQWVPLLAVVMLFGVPFGWILVREWRRNQPGKKHGHPLGFHFSPESTFWRESIDKVWIIPRDGVASIHLSSKMNFKRPGVSPNLILIGDFQGQIITVPEDFALVPLWRALRDQHPKARATFASDLDAEVNPRRVAPANVPPKRAEAPSIHEPPEREETTIISVLQTAPDVPAPPQAPPLSSIDPERWDWNIIYDYFRVLFAGQGIAVQWGQEQPTGETHVNISRPLQVQWQTLIPFGDAIDGEVGDALKLAIAQGRETEWVSLRKITLTSWVTILA
ncbi:MAG: hypothetical protein RL693_465 [Verrucomicrobiota bacterium]|jgi:hypothetical protein